MLTPVSRGRGESRNPVFPGLSRYAGPWWISQLGEGAGEGAVMAISRGKPCPGSGADIGFPEEGGCGPELVLLPPLPGYWTVVAIAMGGGGLPPPRPYLVSSASRFSFILRPRGADVPVARRT